MGPTSAAPEAFTRAVAGLRAAAPREEILLEEIAAPQRLAPFGFALSATVLRDGDEVASGRLILLHDPDGHDAWRGNLRLVTLITAELESDMAGDPLLPAVAWTWLTDGLDQHLIVGNQSGKMSQARKIIDQGERKSGFAEARFTGNQDAAIAEQDRRCMQILRLAQLSLSR